MSTPPHTAVYQTLQDMIAEFNPAQARGVNAVVQLNATGNGGGEYAIHIVDGHAKLSEGVAENATTVITVAAKDWLAIVSGQMDATAAYMTGKLKVSGDVLLMMKFQKMFSA
jgi:putative sterol carrier protein